MTLNNNSLKICQMGCAQTTGALPQSLGVPRVGGTAPFTQLT